MIKENDIKKSNFMKNALFIFGLLICILCLCGCESSEEDREKIFASLKKEKIISDSMEQIDTMTFRQWGAECCLTDIYYIYRGKNSNLIAITYDYEGYKKDTDYDHLVTIYYDVTINDDVNLINSEGLSCNEDGYYYYQNGEYTDNGRYELRKEKEYYATEKSALFKGKYYSFKLVN